MRDLLTEIWNSLRQNKLRTALTGFAVAWGIFMLIALLGAGNGVLNALTSNEGAMEHSMRIYPGFTSKAWDGFEKWRGIRFDERDIDVLGEGDFARNVEEVTPTLSRVDSLNWGKYHLSCVLRGISPIYKQIENIELLAGRFINEIDETDLRKSVVIGSTAADILLDGGAPSGMIGEYLRIGPFPYRVVGVYKSDESEGGMRHEVYLPYRTMKAVYGPDLKISSISFSFHGLETDAESDAFEDAYRAVINARHNAAPDDNSTVYIWNRLSDSRSVGKVIRIIRTALWILGLFSLISGVVGVSNIMLITVRERTHEFGIRKAIGAKPSSLLLLIITESVLITAFFGYIGMVAGLAANEIMDATLADKPIDAGIAQINMFLNPRVGMDVALKATLVLIVAGTIAGLIPARRASKVKPIEALRAD